jgi:acetyl-CoA carboxylase biotin carboxylase subunit
MGRIEKILIANRGEIAVRVIKTARKMGIRTVAVYSEIDSDSLHVAMADEAWCIGKVELSETYLNIPRIIETATRTGCDAIHPGYGFLAENAAFVKACSEAGITFIGPGTDAMRIMGNKIGAREFVRKINIPMTAGISGTPEALKQAASGIGFPVLLKAAAGGGGKGMRIVYREDELDEAIESASRQAKAYFGDETVYIEKYIEEPRHIEVQILGDHHGNVIHLFERECSIQRRYQKIIEESPSPTLTPEVRTAMGEAAVKIGKAIEYHNAGTIEFLVDKALNFYFLEMNTRIQVEHPVTELVTGIDIVEEQILIASGLPLRYRQEEIRQTGHAIECRIYAEDPANNFQPSPGKMSLYLEPALEGIRIDTGISAGTEIKSSFDPMICKLIVSGKDRYDASRKMLLALHDYVIHGIRTNITYLKKLLNSDAFSTNAITTKFCDEHTASLNESINRDRENIDKAVPVMGYLLHSLRRTGEPVDACNEQATLWKQIGYWRNRMEFNILVDEKPVTVYIPSHFQTECLFVIDGQNYIASPSLSEKNKTIFSTQNHQYTVWISEMGGNQALVSVDGHIFQLKRTDLLAEVIVASGFDRHGAGNSLITTPMPGKVIKVMVKSGDMVVKGAGLMIIEAMKMENLIVAPRDGRVKDVFVSTGDRVESGKGVVEFGEEELNNEQ